MPELQTLSPINEHNTEQLKLRRIRTWFFNLEKNLTRTDIYGTFWNDMGTVNRRLFAAKNPVDHAAVDAIVKRAQTRGYRAATPPPGPR